MDECSKCECDVTEKHSLIDGLCDESFIKENPEFK